MTGLVGTVTGLGEGVGLVGLGGLGGFGLVGLGGFGRPWTES